MVIDIHWFFIHGYDEGRQSVIDGILLSFLDFGVNGIEPGEVFAGWGNLTNVI